MKGIKAEYLKIKNTPTVWFTIVCALFLPFVIFLIYFFRHKHFIPQEGVNTWINYSKIHYQLLVMFFPFYLILSAALNLNIEHKSKSWKKLLLLPISRTRIFGDKGIFLLLQTVFSLLLFLATMIALGYLLGIIYPELKMLTYSPDLLFAFSFLGRVLMGSLAILSIHYVLSLFLENMIIPITAGIIGVIISLVISTKWKYAIYFPYSFLNLLYNDSFGKMVAEKWMGVSISEWVSILLSVTVIAMGAWMFNKKQLK